MTMTDQQLSLMSEIQKGQGERYKSLILVDFRMHFKPSYHSASYKQFPFPHQTLIHPDRLSPHNLVATPPWCKDWQPWQQPPMSHFSGIWGKGPPWATEQSAARLERQGWGCGTLQANGSDGLHPLPFPLREKSRLLIGCQLRTDGMAKWASLQGLPRRAPAGDDARLSVQCSRPPGFAGFAGVGWLGTPLPPSHIRTMAVHDEPSSAQTAHRRGCLPSFSLLGVMPRGWVWRQADPSLSSGGAPGSSSSRSLRVRD